MNTFVKLFNVKKNCKLNVFSGHIIKVHAITGTELFNARIIICFHGAKVANSNVKCSVTTKFHIRWKLFYLHANTYLICHNHSYWAMEQ